MEAVTCTLIASEISGPFFRSNETSNHSKIVLDKTKILVCDILRRTKIWVGYQSDYLGKCRRDCTFAQIVATERNTDGC